MAARRFFSLTMFRFSIRQLLASTAVVALGCVALRSASPLWVAALLGLVFLLLAASLPLAIFRQTSQRAYWIGFAMFGWLYMLLLAYSWSLDPNTSQNNPLRPYSLVTTQLSSSGYNRIYAAASEVPTVYYPATGSVPMMGNSATINFQVPTGAYTPDNSSAAYTVYLGTNTATPAFNGPSHDDFINVAHALWAILLATCGGWFTSWVYVTRPTTQSEAADGSVITSVSA